MNPGRPHTIIIGSGGGGLACALFLARAGHRVTVLEKHFIPGGCLQTFVRNGVRFDTGMHLVGSCRAGESLDQIWQSLGLTGTIPLSPLDPDRYHTMHLHGDEFVFASGRDAWIETLANRFPKQRDSLAKYFDAVSSVAEASMLTRAIGNHSGLDALARYQTQSIDNVIESMINDPMLRDVVVADLPLHAPVRNISPFSQHAFITAFYNRSSFRISGGSDIIAEKMIDNIRALGGEVITSAEVTRILTSSGVATGVEINRSRFMAADYVVSDIHPARLMPLIDPGALRPAFCKRMASLPNTIGVFTLYIEFKPSAVSYEPTNHFVYSGDFSPWDCEDYTQDDWPRGYLYMHQSTPGSEADGFARSAIVISFMKSSETSQWEHLPVGHRGEDYERFKAMKTQVLLDKLINDFPELKGCVERVHASTPATFASYTGTPGGSLYGVLRDFNNGSSGRVPYRTRIPNLMLTGQNTNSHGILGISVGAFMTALQIEPQEKMLHILNTPFKAL